MTRYRALVRQSVLIRQNCCEATPRRMACHWLLPRRDVWHHGPLPVHLAASTCDTNLPRRTPKVTRTAPLFHISLVALHLFLEAC